MEEPVKKKDEDWMQKKWRPAMGWMYMIVCMLDMAIFPVLWSLVQVLTKQPITQWNPLTLQGAGLFHLAMGAVLGIAAWGRTQEKVAGAAVNPSSPVPMGMPSSSPMMSSPVSPMGSSPMSMGSNPMTSPMSPTSVPSDDGAVTPAIRRPVVRPNLSE